MPAEHVPVTRTIGNFIQDWPADVQNAWVDTVRLSIDRISKKGGAATGRIDRIAEGRLRVEERPVAFRNDLTPTPLDMSGIDATLLEMSNVHGPFGAKGIGEMPNIPRITVRLK